MSEDEARDPYVNGQFTPGSAGNFEQDDTVAWEGAPARRPPVRAMRKAWMGWSSTLQQGNRQSEVDQLARPLVDRPGPQANTGYGEHAQLQLPTATG